MALDGREVRHWAEVHDFLDVALREHRKARLATAHDIGMIAEDVERVARERTCAYVEDARQLLAGDFVHVGNHEEQALRRGVGGREGTRSERAVHGAGGTAFGFHLDDLDLGTEDIFGPMRGPLVDEVCHGA